MKARGLQPKHNNTHSICFTLLKACYNRTRRAWRPGGYPPRAEPSGPYSALGSGLRAAEARQLLHVLEHGVLAGLNGAAAGGTAGSRVGQGQQHGHGRRYTFVDNADNINWPLLALSTYRCVGKGSAKQTCSWCFHVPLVQLWSREAARAPGICLLREAVVPSGALAIGSTAAARTPVLLQQTAACSAMTCR